MLKQETILWLRKEKNIASQKREKFKENKKTLNQTGTIKLFSDESTDGSSTAYNSDPDEQFSPKMFKKKLNTQN